MRKEFESGLAKRIAGKKAEKRVLGKAFMAVVLGAVLLAGSAAIAAAQWNGDDNGVGGGDVVRLRDDSCLEDPLTVSDGVCDCPCGCTCDNCDCACPCCADAP